MRFRPTLFVFSLIAAVPFVLAAQQESKVEPTCEQVFKNIQVFKGVPAKDLIPAMEFMSASLKYECKDCHDGNDFAAENRAKETTRHMVELQRDINKRFFEGRLSVTCMSCHNGREHPLTVPVPDGASLRHARFTSKVRPEDLTAKHIAAIGKNPVLLTRTGTLTSPTGENKKDVVSKVELIQASDGRFRMVSGLGKFGFDGKTVWRDGNPMNDEPAAIFSRFGRSWRGTDAFAGLEKFLVVAKEPLGKQQTTVVRGTRTSTGSTEEMYFDDKSGLLRRFVNVTRSTLGNVVSVFDYLDYKSVSGTQVPMKTIITFADGSKWTFTYKSVATGVKSDDRVFSMTSK